MRSRPPFLNRFSNGIFASARVTRIAFAAATTAIFSLSARADDKLQFNRDIRPIFSDNCFSCHGTDAKKREAKLRLDTAEGAYKANDDGEFPIKPGDLAKSDAWQRITSDDKDEIMPPPKSHKKLTAAQKETIKRWIEQGAPYQKHWAFEVPVLPPVPVQVLEVLSPKCLGIPSHRLRPARSLLKAPSTWNRALIRSTPSSRNVWKRNNSNSPPRRIARRSCAA